MKNFKRKVKFDDFIYELPNQLSPHFCKQLIKKYEKTYDKHGIGVVGNNNEVVLDLKQSEDLYIRDLDEFKVEREVINFSVRKLLQNYANHLGKIYDGYRQMFYSEFKDSGSQIQKTTPGGFYSWHSDFLPGTDRYLTYIYYLNDVKKKGYTEFANGRKIKPEQGKGIMFPAQWDFIHRGVAPKKELKYIVTGWLAYGST